MKRRGKRCYDEVTYLLLAIIATGELVLDGLKIVGEAEGRATKLRVGVGASVVEGVRVGDEDGLIDLVTVGEDVGAGVGLTVGAGDGANVGVSSCKIKKKKEKRN